MAKLTAPRRAGLEVVAKWHPAAVARSNSTADSGLVYWQTADWLVEQGYASPAAGQTARHYSEFGLTDKGADLCRSEGIALPDEGSPTVATVTADPTPIAATFAVLPIDQLVPSPGNLRRDLGDLEGLAASIKADGVLQALLVTPDFPDSGRWMVLAGHRRLAAARMAGLTGVPCMIREAVPEDNRVATYLVENLQRAGLAALEEAEGYRRLVALGWSQRKIAEHVGCTQSHVSKRLALLDLPEDIRARVDLPSTDAKRITLEDAAELHKLVDHPKALARVARGHIPSLVDEALRRIEYDEAVARLKADAERRGWVLRTPPEVGVTPTYKTIGLAGSWPAPELEIDPEAHATEPCHAVLVERPSPRGYYGSPPKALRAVCIDPERHAKRGGESKIKVKAQPKPKVPEWQRKEAEERLARDEAKEARRVALHQILTGKLDAKDTTRRVLAHFVSNTRYGVPVACELLGLDGEPGTYDAVLQAAGEVDAVRVAFALLIGQWETAARQPYGYNPGPPDELLGFLMAAGYTPTEWELGLLAERAAARAEAEALDGKVEAMFADDEAGERTVDEDPPCEPPDGAVAWYRGFSDDDPARWLDDEGEAESIFALDPDRVEFFGTGDAAGIDTAAAAAG
jgi:ParB/RepB/Spo0J family partition protein